MKMTKTLMALALAGVASANALTFTDKDLIFSVLNSGNPSYSGTFQIDVYDGSGPNGAGYNASTMTLTYAEVGFNFTSYETTYSVKYNVGDGDVIGSGAPSGTTFAVGGVVGSIAFNDLDADGQLGYTVTFLSGTQFTLDTASLLARADRNSVPDGGTTAMLLGVGMVALGALRRKA